MIGKDWKRLARELRFRENAIERIEYVHKHNDVMEMCVQVLKEWHLVQQDGFNVDVLIQSLKNIKRNDIANEIVKLQKSAIKDSVEVFLKEVKGKLKEYYSTLKMRGLPWMREIRLNLQDYYVDLNLKSRSKEQQSRPIKLEQIFRAKKPSRILLEGAIGYGKTSLCSKLCFDWARDEEYLKCFDLVFFFPLRNFDSKLDDMLFRATRLDEGNRIRFEQLMQDKSKRILIVLDGLDELQPSYKAHILPLLERDTLNHVTVAVTSRPGHYYSFSRSENHKMKWFTHGTGVATDDGNASWDINITILGISETMQMNFMIKYLEECSIEKRESILCQLKLTRSNNLLPSEFLKSPLFLLMVILMLSQNKITLPVRNKTDLYMCLFNFVLQRYLVVKKNMFTLQVNPLHIQPMVQFGELSLNALQSDKLYLHEDELPVCNGVCEVAEIGFLIKNMSQDAVESKVTYEPIHKSMMEFAAAYYLWLSFTKGPRNCWDNHVPLLVKLRPRYNSDTSSLLFSFLVELIGKEASCLFNILQPFASEYNECFGSLSYLLMKNELATALTNNDDAILISLLTLLPSTWLVPWENDHGFSTSAQHVTILQFGVDRCKIKAIKWNVHEESAFPKDLKIKTLIAEFTEPTAPVFPCNKNKLYCESLFVSIPSGIINVQSFQDVIQAVEFESMSVHLSNDASVVRLCYKDVQTAKANVKNVVNLCGLHVINLQISLMSSLTTLVRQDVLKTLDLKLKSEELVLVSFFSLFILCSLQYSLPSGSLSTICLFFIFWALSVHVDDSFDSGTIKCINLLLRILPTSMLNSLTVNVCLRVTVFHVLTVLLLFLITQIIFSQLWCCSYWITFCVCVVYLTPQSTHINIVVKSWAFVVVNHYFLDFFSPNSIVNTCLLIYSMFCIDFSYHLFLRLSDVCGGVLTFLYFIIFVSLPLCIPVPYSIALVSVLYLGFLVLLVMYPNFGLFQYLQLNSNSTYRSYNPNDRIHNFFKNVFICTCNSLVFYIVVYRLFSFSSVGRMCNYVCPLLPLLPSLFPSFVFSWLCNFVRCRQMSKIHFHELIKSAGTSMNLKQFVLGNQYRNGWFPQLFFLFAVDLSEVCNKGLKSWHWLQIEDVEIRGSQNIKHEFEIEHFDFSKADFSYSDNFFRLCRITSLVCRSSFLNAKTEFWSSVKASLKELYVRLDESLNENAECRILPEMQNVEVFGVMITKHSSASISFSFENIISEKEINDFEIWYVENNYDLAFVLIESIVTMLHSPCKPIKYSKLRQLVLLTNIAPDAELIHLPYSGGFAAIRDLIKCSLHLKKLLENALLQIDIVCRREVLHYMSRHESKEIVGSWVDAFPPHEGYTVTHDFWGTADEDSIRSKGLARQFPDRYHRFSIRKPKTEETKTFTKSKGSTLK